jgi:2,4-diketo-3-deoxy-L-fuconate hydrolase
MKLIRVGPIGHEKPAVLTGDGTFVDISDLTRDVDGSFLERLNVADLGTVVASRLADGQERSLEGLRIGAPIARPHQIVCIGLNYADHAAESGMPIPDEPIVFNKSPNTLVGPRDEIRIPRGSEKTDWEVELGVVIGSECRYLESPEEAWSRIAGLVVSNDVSEREFQLERGGQWVKGKSCETFNPCGPWLVTLDDIPDVRQLAMWLDINGERQQTGSTATMIFEVPFLVWYLSQFMVLEPGDLINTGTPPGVGMGKSPQRFLVAGDVVELGIEHLGAQRQACIPAP